jgi:hypothetical protein
MPSQQKRVRRASVSDALSERSRLMSPLSHIAHISKVQARPSDDHQDLRTESPIKVPEFVNTQYSVPEEIPRIESKTYAESISTASSSQQHNEKETKKSMPHELPRSIEDQDEPKFFNRVNDIKEGQYLWGACGVMLGTAIGAIPAIWRFIGTNSLSFEGFVQIILFFSSLTLGLFLLMTGSRR